jgi:alanine dehydrogenase
MNRAKIKIGIIKEGKVPPDSRVPMTPRQCIQAMHDFPVKIVVETCPSRCYKDKEFTDLGVEVTDDLSDCDLLMGVKEVPVHQLLPNKTYLFFSHTIKKQPYNRKLLWAVLDKHIRLIDYEVLKDENGDRLIAFGRFAGMVGAHNALWTFGQRTGKISMPRMKDFHDYEEAKAFYHTLELPPLKIVLTGTGRVANGSADVLRDMGFRQVSPSDFLGKEDFPTAVFTQLHSEEYVARKDGAPYLRSDFHHHPELFKGIFAPFYKVADVMINGIYWDCNAPAFFSVEEMASPDFKIQVIADVTCDIAPDSSIPSTLRASTIADPVFGFNPRTGEETPPYTAGAVDVMSIDNLPNEMPRDASEAFGNQFLQNILPEFFKPESRVLDEATIAANGHLTSHFRYLEDYANDFASNGLLA